jgi:glycosyltransferase involved in cell wall biosynthesis
MPEVAAESALLVDPGEVEEIAGALARLLDSDSLQASLGGCARNVAERYRWEECARLSWEFFERIARE